MKTTELAELIKTRRSIRVFQDKPVPEEMLLQAIELATWAPNGGNQQNWRFYVVLNKKTINDIADAVQTSADLIESWAKGPGAKARPVNFRNAPALIIVAAGKYQSDADKVLEAKAATEPMAKKIREWRMVADSRIQSTSAAVAYLLLVLHQMGLGGTWMTGPMQAKEQIEKVLKIPAEMDAVTLIPVGYPAESPVSKGRKPVKEVCEVIK